MLYYSFLITSIAQPYHHVASHTLLAQTLDRLGWRLAARPDGAEVMVHPHAALPAGYSYTRGF